MKTPWPDKELEIVRCCAGLAVADCFVRDLRAGIEDGPVDWPKVLALAGQHGLAGFVYKALANHGKDLVPEAVLGQLKKMYFQNSTRNLYLGATLLKILNLFKQHRIDAVGFKGPVQSEVLFQDIGIRTFFDLDILVRKDQAVRARNLLMDQGFSTDIHIPASQEKVYLEKENFFQLADATKRINIDLHWEITGRYNLVPVYYPGARDLEDLRLLGTRIKTLKPEDMLIHLCIHGSSHCWDRLEMICSVAVIAGGGMIQDWTRVFIRAKVLRCYRMVLLGLGLARHCFAVDLPPALANTVAQDAHVEKLCEYILNRITKGEVAFSESLNWRFSPMHFQVRDSFRDRVAYLFRLFFRPTVREWDQYPLPVRFLFLYPVLRPFRLLMMVMGSGRSAPVPEERCETPSGENLN
ncbi:MAG: nucleotidyltransferase family protein [Thermodesulfobacteriota bacterium]|nr:nucleotidyltransferase family protein [Thermodesulfobacteriota bacterium]